MIELPNWPNALVTYYEDTVSAECMFNGDPFCGYGSARREALLSLAHAVKEVAEATTEVLNVAVELDGENLEFLKEYR